MGVWKTRPNLKGSEIVEEKKLIKFSRASYALLLPKDWVRYKAKKEGEDYWVTISYDDQQGIFIVSGGNE
ncbi:hypothetical protein ES703_04131 [subsurface metagenome]